MNGISLLVAFAALGVDVGWEAVPPDNKLVYTIRIESVLLEQLRGGSATVSRVDKKDRSLSTFRVAMGPKGPNERPPSATNNEVQYGWRPNENGGMDYYVQMSPERLETLAKGIPIDCQVDPAVSEIERIYVFVGTSVLPREGGATSSALTAGAPIVQPNPPVTNAVAQASGTDSRLSAPQLPGSSFQPQPSVGGSNATVPSGNSNTAPGNAFGGDRWSGQTHGGAYAGQSGAAATTTSTQSTGGGYGQHPAGTLAIPDIRPQEGTNHLGAYGTGRSPYESRNETVARQPAHEPLHQQSPPANYQPNPSAWGQYANAPPPNYSHVAPANYAAVQAPVQQPLTPASTSVSETKEAVKPWTPLVLTTLALFASIGANAYLGWLAWSFFWRYRDTASDLARTRSAMTGVRQAA